MTDDRQRLLRYAYMRLAREVDSRFEKLLLSGRVAKWYSEVGNEATTVSAGLAIGRGDVLCTLHRDLGAILAYYLDPVRTFPGFGFGEEADHRPAPRELLYRLVCQLLGRADGFSGGVERSYHYGYLAPEAGLNHVGMISHLGAMIPVAAGCAFALKRSGTDRVAVNFIGDGGTSTGDFHEGLNMAAVWNLPLVLVIENNRYAFSTPVASQYAAARLSDRGLGYGVPAVTVDGNDPDLMSDVLGTAVERARRGEGPTLIEAMLGRMRGHGEGDDSLKVVPADELAAYRAADPVPAFKRKLTDEGVLDQALDARLLAHVTALVEEVVDAGLAAEMPREETARRSVFAPATPGPGSIVAESTHQRGREAEVITYVQAITQALEEEMERDETVVLMGQDIAVFEGAFRVTPGFHRRWPDRVLDTPIAESGTLGVAIGAALLGYRPVVEMQFADFIACGFNQVVNVAAKLFYRWEAACPLVIRLPSGGGVTAGPFHSQNPESWFAHVAGLKVICPATVEDAWGLLRASIQDPNPVLFFEHKYLYRRTKAVRPSGESLPELGRARILRQGGDLTMIGYGAMTWACLEAAEVLATQGVEAEVVDLRSLVPLDEETLRRSVEKTARALVVHEAQRTAGFGAEIVARLAESSFYHLDAPIVRVAYPDLPVPYARVLEAALLPDVEQVVAAARDLMTK